MLQPTSRLYPINIISVSLILKSDLIFCQCSQEGGRERREREFVDACTWQDSPALDLPHSGKYSWDNFVGEYFKVHWHIYLFSMFSIISWSSNPRLWGCLSHQLVASVASLLQIYPPVIDWYSRNWNSGCKGCSGVFKGGKICPAPAQSADRMIWPIFPAI